MPFLAREHLPIPNKDLISWMFDTPKYDVDKPIYTDATNPKRTLSSKQARIVIRKLVAGLFAAGLQEGDCVCVHSFNDIYYSMLVLGIIAAGGVFTGTNPSYTPFELAHHLKTSRTKFLIVEPELLDSMLVAAKECKVPDSRIWVFDIHEQAIPHDRRSWSDLLQHGESDWLRFEDQTKSMNTPAALLFSSGTTGLPKAAILSHYNLVAQHTLAVEPNAAPYKVSRLLYLPMFHAAIVPLGHTSPLKDGSQAYVMRRFDTELFLVSIQTFKITELIVVPPIVLAVLASPLTKNYDLTSVKSTLCGAAALGKVQQRQFEQLLASDACFNQVWGMTETSCVASRFWWPENDETGSIGRFISNLDVKLIDDRDRDITAPGATGELLVRGATIISGYYHHDSNSSSSNRATYFDAEGYFRTGDIVTCASDWPAPSAKWYIVDRKKELIKVRGFQVSPAELEAVILQHPDIVDAAVIGVPLPESRDGEHPRAYVVQRGSGATVSAQDVAEWCSQRLAKYKALSGGVVFMEELPRNASGKLLKRVLREQTAKEIEAGGTKL